MKSSEINPENLSNKLLYAIIGLFVVIFIIIIVINQQNKTLASSSVQGQAKQAEGQLPKMDADKLNQLKSRIENDPYDKNSILELANMYHDYNNVDEAIVYYNKYLTIDEKDPDARVDMALCLFEKHDNETAIKEILKAISIEPNHQKAHFNLGIIYLSSGRVSEAMTYFKNCYEIDPMSEVGQNSKQLLAEHKSVIK
jgi:tetratricopeptide (TPR) repeat protein